MRPRKSGPAFRWWWSATVRARRADDIDEVLGAAVAQIVAVDAGNHHIRSFRARRLIRPVRAARRVGRQRLAVADVAERAAAGADVAEDHEGGRAAPEAFADVGAGGFLADGVQLLSRSMVLISPKRPALLPALTRIHSGLRSGSSTGTILIGMRAVFSSPLLDAFLLRAFCQPCCLSSCCSRC
jgi:hypothetical protein